MGNEEEWNTKVLVRSVMSPYEGAKKRVRVDPEFLEAFMVKVGMQKGFGLTPLFFVVVADVVKEFARLGALSELLYADDIVLISETIKVHINKFTKWKEAFESKGMKVNFGKTKQRHHKGWHVKK